MLKGVTEMKNDADGQKALHPLFAPQSAFSSNICPFLAFPLAKQLLTRHFLIIPLPLSPAPLFFPFLPTLRSL
jgi:hypothetical protein